MYAFTPHPDLYSGSDRMTEPMVVEIMGMNLVDSVNPDQLSSLVDAAAVCRVA